MGLNFPSSLTPPNNPEGNSVFAELSFIITIRNVVWWTSAQTIQLSTLIIYIGVMVRGYSPKRDYHHLIERSLPRGCDRLY
jgi:hypothetical protein